MESPHASFDEVSVVLSPRNTVTISDLTGLESINADKAVGEDYKNPITIAKIYGLFSIRSINGERVEPIVDNLDLSKRVGKFSGSELFRLGDEFGKRFMAEPDKNDLKNASAAPSAGA